MTVSPIGAKGVVGATQQTVATDPNAHAIITDSTNKYVFHTSLGGDAIYQQKFDAKTGKLSPNDPATVKTNAKAGPRHLVFSPNNKFVYLLNELDATVYVFPYDAAKGTMKKEVQTVSAMPKGSSVKPWAADIHITPNGKFLYASERTSSTLAGYSRRSGQGHADADRQLPDREAAARFRHRPDQQISVRGGRALAQPDDLFDRSEDRQADEAEGDADRQEAELDRNRHIALRFGADLTTGAACGYSAAP